jgi:hypothetical protein
MRGESEGFPLSNTPYFGGGGAAAHSDAQQAWHQSKGSSQLSLSAPEVRP